MLVPLRLRFRIFALLAATPFVVGSVGPRTNFNERVLAAHNRERVQMFVPPLKWDDKLAVNASVWAHYLSRTGRFEHSPNPPTHEVEGENIWGGTPEYYLPEDMVSLWISEKKNFRPGVFPATSRSGDVRDVSHYTQLVWRTTTRVGCAVSAEGKEEVLVCRYSSPGNVIGRTVL